MVRKFIKRIKKWSEKRETMAQLSAMSDRDLADIGIKRWQIEEVAAGRNVRD